MLIHKLHRLLWVIIICCFFSACMMGPNYVKPRAIISAHYKEAPPGWQVAKPRDDENRGQWWAIFHDPVLNSLENRVSVNNQNIATALAQFQQSAALLQQTEASLSPMISANSSGVRQKSPFLGSSSIGLPSTSKIANTYALSINASWEPDLWGELRRQVESSRATAEASLAQVAAMKLSMQASLAQDYIQLRTYDALQVAWNNTIDENQQILNLIKARNRAGTATVGDIAAAESQLETAKAAGIDNKLFRAQTEHAIAVLMGLAPADLTLKPNSHLAGPHSVPLQVPSLLLERRPDVATAERNVASASAQIGVAIAALFPNISVTGDIGYTSNTSKRLFTVPAQFWSMGLAVSDSIIDGGARLAQITANRANYRAMVATYRQTVLSAIQEVEDNLVAIRKLNLELIAEQAAQQDASISLNMVKNNYSAGTNDLTDLLAAKIAYDNANRNVIAVKSRQLLAAIGLITALGGGWQGLQPG